MFDNNTRLFALQSSLVESPEAVSCLDGVKVWVASGTFRCPTFSSRSRNGLRWVLAASERCCVILICLKCHFSSRWWELEWYENVVAGQVGVFRVFSFIYTFARSSLYGRRLTHAESLYKFIHISFFFLLHILFFFLFTYISSRNA